MITFLIAMAALMVIVRLHLLHRLWRLPLKHGEGFFLSQRVEPGFYKTAGASLFRRYHTSLLVPLVIDAPLAVWLGVGGRYVMLYFEQFLAMLATIVIYNLIAVHFSARATLIAGNAEERPATAIQLSMTPRRLRDHTRLWVELGVALSMLLAIGLLGYYGAFTPSSQAGEYLHGCVILAVWIAYWEAGLLLLKGVFVRWRMPLPARRTEDFRRWRSAWLSYHLNIFDSVRLLSALVLLTVMLLKTVLYGSFMPQIIAAVIWVVIVAAFLIYSRRQARSLAVVEREIKPVELVKEFPRSPVPQGRFLIGGLLYFNRDNPGVLVRSTQGIAINLARPGAYIWPLYFTGLVVLMIWMAR